jgi:hypothetical protein
MPAIRSPATAGFPSFGGQARMAGHITRKFCDLTEGKYFPRSFFDLALLA